MRHLLAFAAVLTTLAPLGFASFANPCERLLAPAVWIKNGSAGNPLLAGPASSLPLVDRQWQALTILGASFEVPKSLCALAREKLAYFNEPPLANRLTLDRELARMTPMRRIQAALELSLKSFRDSRYDTRFLGEVLAALAKSPESNESTIALLMPLARGVGLPSPVHARLANEAIQAIALRLPSSRSPVVSAVPLGGGVNRTLLVTFRDGNRGVFKPAGGERLYGEENWHSAGQILFPREVSAYDIAARWLRLSGPAQVPETVEAVLVGEDGTSYGVGSLQTYKEGFVTLKSLKESDPERFRELTELPLWQQTEATIRTLDYLLGNYDRFPNQVHQKGNMENLLVRYDGGDAFHAALIDNGVGRKRSRFGSGQIFGIENCPLRGDIPDTLKAAVLAFDAAAFRREYAERLPAEGIEDFIERVEQVRQRILYGP